MRFIYFVLAAAVALLAGCNDVSAASSSTQKLGEVNSANTVAVRALAAEEPDVDTKKNLRADKDDEDDDEDKGLFDYLSDRYKAKRQYRAWYRARMAPKEVTKLLRAREAEGRYVNWDLAEGYDTYYDRRRNSLLYW